MTDTNNNDKVTRLLDELGPADLPPGFSRQVMSEISVAAARPRAPKNERTQGGMEMIRKAMWGLAAAAAVVLVVYSVVGFPPVGRGTEGTVGGAQKAVAQQLTSKDVVTGDASAQAFLQSEAFDKLAKDPDARALISNNRMRDLLMDANVRDLVLRSDVRDVLANADVIAVFSKADLRAELEAAIVANTKVETKQDVRVDAVAQILANARINAVLQIREVRDLLSNAGLRDLMMDAHMARALNSDAFIHALNANGFAAALNANMIATGLLNR
jgi:hypothetical protein